MSDLIMLKYFWVSQQKQKQQQQRMQFLLSTNLLKSLCHKLAGDTMKQEYCGSKLLRLPCTAGSSTLKQMSPNVSTPSLLTECKNIDNLNIDLITDAHHTGTFTHISSHSPKSQITQTNNSKSLVKKLPRLMLKVF